MPPAPKWKRTIATLLAGASPLLFVILGNVPITYGVGASIITSALVWIVLRSPAIATPTPDMPDAPPPPEGRLSAPDILECLPDPLILVDARGRVESANLAARSIYPGFEPGILLSLFVRHPEVLAVTERVRHSQREDRIRFTLRRPKERFIHVLALPLSRQHVALVFHDETERHRAEHMRAGFLANVSHELRTPLASLTGYIDTLSGHAKDDPQARTRFLGIMADQAARMGRLIDDLLSLSRIEMDAHLPPKEQIDLASVLTDVCDALTPMSHKRNISVDLHLPKISAPITGERDQVIQIAQNLIDNAIKYTPDGGTVLVTLVPDVSYKDYSQAPKPLGEEAPSLSIVETPRRANQHFAVLTIRDRGPGIAANHLPRLGERFYRVEAGKTAKHAGTGLGLAIIKHIINRHQGGLYVQSQPGKGTVFSAALPLAKL